MYVLFFVIDKFFLVINKLYYESNLECNISISIPSFVLDGVQN